MPSALRSTWLQRLLDERLDAGCADSRLFFRSDRRGVTAPDKPAITHLGTTCSLTPVGHVILPSQYQNAPEHWEFLLPRVTPHLQSGLVF